jgi:predicted ATP-grasp superfamily ATP-dependent carboligase
MAAPDPRAAAALVDAAASLLELRIDPAYRDGVAEHLARILTAAALVTEFPLPDDIEAAPVFRP